jgi:hypothetical protein
LGVPFGGQPGSAAEADQLANRPPAGVYRVGAQVLASRNLYKVEGKYAEEARKKKLPGTVLLSLVVDANGAPSHIVVPRPHKRRIRGT